MTVHTIAVLNSDAALIATWEAFLQDIPMTWWRP